VKSGSACHSTIFQMSILGLPFIRRPVDGFLLERQKGPGTLSQLYIHGLIFLIPSKSSSLAVEN